MTINTDLLARTLAYIEDHPEEWNQREWRCGTACCFAGHAALLAGWEWDSPVPVNGWMIQPRDGTLMPVALAAQDALGLSDTQADFLFTSSHTIHTLRLLVRELIERNAYQS